MTNRDLEHLRVELNGRFDVIDGRFDVIDERFDVIDERFAAVGDRFGGVGRRFDALDQRLKDLDDGLDRRVSGVVFQAINNQTSHYVGWMFVLQASTLTIVGLMKFFG